LGRNISAGIGWLFVSSFCVGCSGFGPEGVAAAAAFCAVALSTVAFGCSENGYALWSAKSA
jgi:hypothetical protein